MAKKKEKINEIHGILNLFCSKNNTIATIRNKYGNVLCWTSCGQLTLKDNPNKKFTGKEKKSENASFLTVKSACKKAYKLGVTTLSVFFKYYGSGINIFLKAIKQCKIKVHSINDITPFAFNGCRPQKKRRKKRHIKNKEYNYVKRRYQKEYD